MTRVCDDPFFTWGHPSLAGPRAVPYNPAKVASAGPLYAHYTNDRTVRITDNIRPVGGIVFKVKGKREARTIAYLHNAKCWNF